MKDSVQINLEKLIRNKFKNFDSVKKIGKIKDYLAKIKKWELDELSRKEGIELISLLSSL
jgi:hypothetical protein